MAVSSLNCVIMGASGRVGGLLRAALNATPPENARFFWAGRQADPAALADFAAQAGGIDAILCLRGVVAGRRGADGSPANVADNSRLALETCDLARRYDINHVFLTSSAAVYGPPDGTAPLAETATPAPVAAYGRAKLAMEQAALARPDMAERLTCLRIGNVAGADQLLVNAFAGMRSGMRPLMLDRFTDGQSPLRSYIGPETLARCLVALFRHAAAGTAAGTVPLPALLNVTAPCPVEMADLLEALHDHLPDLSWQSQPAPATALPCVALDATRLTALVPFNTKDSTAPEIIRQVLACRGAL